MSKSTLLPTLVILTLAVTAVAVPLGVQVQTTEDKCASVCTTTDSQYAIGKTYIFEYNTETRTELKGSSGELSGLAVSATAHIEILDKCEFALTLPEVRLEELDSRRQESPASYQFRKELQAQPLRFSFNEGLVSSLCPGAKESRRSLNFKRALLSAFQNGMNDLDKEHHSATETDVSGECNTDYKVTERPHGKVHISRSKQLLDCNKRSSTSLALQLSPYSSEEGPKSMPLLRSTHNCDQVMSTTGQLMSSDCNEMHVFRPFSDNDNGATTTATQKLRFIKEKAGTKPRGAISSRKSMIFEHDHDEQTEGKRIEAERILNKMCDSTDVKPETPGLFSELVNRLRPLDADTLQVLRRRVRGGRVCASQKEIGYQHFLDAIPMISTTDSLELMANLITSGDVYGTDAQTWISSLAFISRPNAKMMEPASKLLDTNKQRGMLEVSSLVRGFCLQNENCADNTHVIRIMQNLDTAIPRGCRITDSKTKSLVLTALKSLGNMGASSRIADSVSRCLTTDEPEVRVAAIDAYRRVPCNVDRSRMKDIFDSTEEDSEIRIAAFLGLMQCASKETIEMARLALEKEQADQVGSFMWTYLTNLAETSSPLKQEVAALLKDQELSTKFDLDKRKFSRNVEGSFFLEGMNTGASAESNLIWSQRSFIPRSMNLNLTVDMFGSSVNLLEVGGRVEGLEQLLERYTREQDNKLPQARSKREINSNKLNRINKQFGMSRDDIKASGFVRIFGNDVMYRNMDIDKQTNFNSQFNFLDFALKLTKYQQTKFSKTYTFLDTTFTIPTLTGFPLTLAVNGTAAVHLKLGGQLDMRQINSFIVRSDVEPSAAVEISGMMTVDAGVAKTGIGMITTLHSSTAGSASVTLKNGKVFNAKLDMPQQKQTIVNVKSRVFTIHRDSQRDITTPSSQYKITKCTGSGLQKALGLEVCASLSYPSGQDMKFPFGSNTEASVMLTRTDDFTSYEMEANFEKFLPRILLDTPGSKINRKILLEGSYEGGKGSLVLDTPWKKASIIGSLEWDSPNKKFEIEAVVDGQTPLKVFGSRDITNSGGMSTQKVHMQLTWYRRTYVARGEVQMSDKSLSTEITLRNPENRRFAAKGAIKMEGNKYSVSSEVKSDAVNAEMSAVVQEDKQALSLNSQFAVNDHKLTFNGKMRNLSSARLNKYSVSSQWKISNYPNWNAHIGADTEWDDTHEETNIVIQHGDDETNENKRITLGNNMSLKEGSSFWKLNTISTLKYPLMDLDSKLELDTGYNRNGMNAKAIAQYVPGKDARVEVSLNNKPGRFINSDGKFAASLLGKEFSFSGRINQQQEANYVVKMQSEHDRKQLAKFTSNIEKTDNKLTMSSDLHLPMFQPIHMDFESNCNMRNFQMIGNLELAKTPMSLETSYKINTGYGKFSVIATHPERQLKGSGELKIQQSKLESSIDMMWDAQRDPTRRIQSEVSLARSGASVQMSARTTVLGQVFASRLNNNVDGTRHTGFGEIQWNRNKISVKADSEIILSPAASNVRSTVSVTTPFDIIPETTVTVNVFNNDKQFNGEGSVKFGSIEYGTSITMTASPNMEMSVKVNTPINNFEESSAAISISTVKPAFTLSGKIGNKHHFNLDSKAHVKSATDMTGSMKFRSTWSMARRIDFAGALTPIQAELNFAVNRRAIGFKVVKDDSGPTTTYSGELNTPFAPVENIGFTAIAEEGRIDGEVKYSQKTLAKFALSGKVVSTNKMNGAMKIKVPGMDEISLNLDMDVNAHQASLSMGCMWEPTKEVRAALSASYGIHGYELTSIGSLEIRTPFRSARRMKIEWNHENHDLEVTTTVKVIKNRQNFVVRFDGELQKGWLSRTIIGSVKVESTVPEWNDVGTKLHGVFTLQGAKINSATTVSTGKNVEFVVDVDINRIIKLEIKTPYVGKERMGGEFSWEFTGTKSSVYCEFNWPRGTIIVSNSVSGSSTTGFQYNAKLATPFKNWEEYTCALRLGKNSGQWEGNARVAYKNKAIEVTSTCKTAQPFAASIVMTTPFELRKVQYDLSYNTMKGLKGQSSLVVEPYLGKIQVDLRQLGLDAQVNVKTPFTGYESFRITSESGRDEHTTTVDYPAGTMKLLLLSGRTGSSKQYTAYLTTPFMPRLRVESTYTGQLSANKLDAAVRVFSGKNKLMDSNINYSYEQDMTLTWRFNSVWQPIKSLSARASLATSDGFIAKGAFAYAPYKTITTDVAFKPSQNGFTLSASMDSPCPIVKSLDFKTKHNGLRYGFDNSMEMSYNEEKIMSYTGTVRYGRKKAGEFKVDLPTTELRNLGMGYELKGDSSDWTTSANLRAADKPVFKGEMGGKFVSYDNINIHANLEETDYMTESELSFKHNGQLKKGNTELKLKSGDRLLTSSANYKILSLLESDVTLKFGTTSVGIITSGTPLNPTATVTVQKKEANGKVLLNFDARDLSNIDGKVEFECSRTGRSFITFSQKMSTNSFQNTIDATYRNEQIFTSDISLGSTAKACTGSLKLKSAWSKDFEISFSGKKADNSFEIDVVLPYGSSRLETGYAPKSSGASVFFKLNTPFSMARRLHFNFDHSGSLEKFSTTLNGRYNGKVGKLEAALDVQDWNQITGSFKTDVTGMNPLTAELKHDKSSRRVASYLKATHGTNKLVDINMNASNRKNTMTGEVELVAPSPLKISFKHTGGLRNFKNEASFFHSGRDNKIAFELNTQDIANMMVGASIDSFISVAVQLAHMKTAAGFKEEASVIVDGKTHKATAMFENSDKFVLSASLDSTYSGHFRYTHTGSIRDFECSLDAKAMDATLSSTIALNTRNLQDISGKFALDGPIPELELSYKHQGKMPRFQCTIVGKMGKQMVNTNVKFDLKTVENFNIEVSARGSIPTVALKYTHTGSPRKFQCTLDGSYGKQNINMDLNVDATNIQDLKATLTSAGLFPDMVFNFKHSGHIRNCACTLNAKYGQYTQDMKVNVDSTNLRNIVIEGESSGILDADVKLSHVGSVRRFQTTAAGSYYGKKFNMKLKSDTRNLSNMVIDSKITGIINAEGKMTHFGSFPNCESTVSGTYNGQEFVSSLKTDLRNLGKSVIELKTTGIFNADAKFTNTGSLRKFTTTLTGSCKGKTYDFSLNLDARTLDNINFSVIGDNVLPDISVKYIHRGGLQKFDCDFDASFNKKTQKIDVTWDATNSRNVLFSAVAKGHYKANVEFKHRGIPTKFRTSFSANCGKGYNSDIQLDVNVIDIKNMKLSLDTSNLIPKTQITFNHAGTARDFNSKLVTTFGKYIQEITAVVKTTSLLDSSIDLSFEGPIYSASLRMTNNGQPDYFKPVVKGQYGDKKFEIIGTVDFKDLTAINVEFSSSGDIPSFSVHFKHNGTPLKFITSAAANFNAKVNSLTAKADFTNIEDLSVDLRSSGLFPHMAVRFVHTGHWSDLRSTLTTEYKDMRAGVKLNTNLKDATDMSADFNTFGELPSASVTFKQTGRIENLHSKLVASFMSYNANINIKWNLDPKDMKMRIRTSGDLPVVNIEFEQQHNNKWLKTAASATYKRTTVGIQGEGTIGKKSSFQFETTGDLPRFTTDASFQMKPKPSGTATISMGRLTYTVAGSADIADLTDMSINANIGGDIPETSISFSQKGTPLAGESRIKGKFMNNDFDIESNLKIKDLSNIEGTINLAGFVPTTTTRFMHTSGSRKFSTEVESSTTEYEIFKASLQSECNTKKTGKLSFSSAILPLEKFEIDFEHEGEINKFTTYSRVQVNEHFTSVKIDSAVKSRKNFVISTDFTSSCKVAPKFGLTVKHRGTPSYFTSEANSYLEEHKFTEKLAVDVRDLENIRIERKKTFDDIVAYDLLFTHKGPWNDFRTNLVDRKQDKSPFSVSVQFQITGPIKCNAKVENAFDIKEAGLSLASKAIVGGGEMQLELYKNTEKISIDTLTKYDEDGFNTKTTLETPWTMTTTGSLIFKGYFDKFDSTLEGRHGPNVAQFNTKFDGNLENLKAAIDYKITGLDAGTIKLTHRKLNNGFNTELDASVNQHDLNAEVTLTTTKRSITTELNGKLTGVLPRTNTKVTITRERKGFSADLNTKGAYTVDSNIKMYMTSDFNAEFTFTSNIKDMESLSGIAVVKGSLKKCNLESKLTTPAGKLVFEYSHDVRNWKNVQITGKVGAPSMEPVTLAYTHTITMGKINLAVELSGETRMNAKVMGNIYDRVAGSLDLTSNVEGLKTVKFDSETISSANTWMTKHSLSTDDGKWGLTGQLATKKLTVDAVTPITGYKKLNFAIVMDNSKKSSTISVRAGRYSIEVTHQMDYERVFTMSTTVITNNIDAVPRKMMVTADITPSLTNFKSDISVQYGRFIVKNKNDVQVRSVTDFEGTINVESVIPGVPRSIEVVFKHKGSIADFQSTFNVVADKKTAAYKGAFSYKEGITGAFELQTLGGDEYSLDFSHAGGLMHFKHEINVTYAGSVMAYTGELDTRESINGNFGLRTPGNAPYTVNFNHAGNMRNFKSSVDANVPFRVQGQVNVNSPRSGSLELISPFHSPIKTSVDIKTSKRSGTTELRYGDRKLVVSGEYKPIEGGYSGSVTVATPFACAKQVSLAGTHAILGDDYKHSGKISVNDQFVGFKSDASVNGHVKDFKAAIDASIESSMPELRNARAVLTHHNTDNSVDSRIQLYHNDNKITDMSMMGQLDDHSMHVKTNTYDAKITIKNTDDKIDIQGTVNKLYTVSFVAERKGKKLSAEVSASNGKRTAKAEGSLLRSSNKLVHEAQFSIDERRAGYKMSIVDRSTNRRINVNVVSRINTPIRTIEVTAKHDFNGRSLISMLEVKPDVVRLPKRVVSMEVEAEVASAMKKFAVTLNKEVVLRSTLITGRDKVVFLSETELEYIPQPDKKLKFTAMLRDLSINTLTNYTLELTAQQHATSLDIRLHGHAASSPEIVSSGLNLSFLTSQGETKHIAAQTRFNIEKRSADLLLFTPFKRIHLSGTARFSGEKLILAMQKTYDDMKSINTELTLDSVRNAFDFMMNYDFFDIGKKFYAFGKWHNDSAVEFAIYSIDGEKRTTEGRLFVALNGRRMLQSALYWRPNAVNELQSLSADKVKKAIKVVKNRANALKDDINREIDAKIKSVSSQFSRNIRPLQNAINEQIQDITRDTAEVRAVLRSFYKNNDLYTKDVVDAAISVSDWLIAHGQRLSDAVTVRATLARERFNHLSSQLRNSSDNLIDQFAMATIHVIEAMHNVNMWLTDMISYPVTRARRMLADMKYEISTRLMQLSESISSALEPIITSSVDIYALSLHRIGHLSESLNSRINELRAKIKAHPQFSYLLEIQDQLLAKLNEFNLQFVAKYIRKAQKDLMDQVDNAQSSLTTKLSNIADSATSTIYGAHDLINTGLESVLHPDDARMMKELVQNAVDNGKWIYNYYKVHESLRSLGHRYAADVRDTLFNEVDAFMKLDQTRFTVWKPEVGQIELQVYLPIAWPRLNRMPDLSKYAHIAHLLGVRAYTASKEKIYDSMPVLPPMPEMPKVDMNIPALYHAYRPSSSPGDWVPPFKGEAMIIGDDEYVTFDHQFYEFSGKCSYLLASDFLDGNFSLSVNYDNGARKSLTAQMNKHTLQMFDTGRVTLDDSKAELPIQIDGLTASRVGQQIVVETNSGLKTTCDLSHEVCSVTVNGLYFGRTGGLLGTYNYEKFDELKTSSGKITKDIKEFTKSWEVGPTCAAHVNLAEKLQTVDEESPRKRICEFAFKSVKSPLAGCFKTIETEKFERLCMANRKGAMCRSVKAYSMMCKTKDIKVKPFKPCMTCSLPDGHEIENDVNTVLPVRAETDVLLVVEERQCNQDVVNSLEQLVKRLSDDTRKLKIDMRVGIVAYGGDGIHSKPHVHTVDGQLLADGSIRTAIKSLQLSATSAPGNALEAVEFAVENFAFRQTATRSILLIPCSASESCGVTNEVSASLRQQLVNSGIALHLLTDVDFQASNYGRAKVFGYDRMAGFSSRHVVQKQVTGDAQLLRRMTLSRDACSSVAVSTNGTVFSSSNIGASRPQALRKQLAVMGRRIATSMRAPVGAHHSCQCTVDVNGDPFMRCTSFDRTHYVPMPEPQEIPVRRTVKGKKS